MNDQPPEQPQNRGRLPYVLVTFIVTEDGEQQHPMNAGIAKMNLTADGTPDEPSVRDLVDRVTREAQRKAERYARLGPAGE